MSSSTHTERPTKKRKVEDTEEETPKTSSWQDKLKNTTVRDLCANKKPIVTLPLKSNLRSALNLLAKHSILSAPVVNEKNEFAGFIDVLDIAGALLTYYQEHSARSDEPLSSVDTGPFFERGIEGLMDFSGVDQPLYVSDTMNLWNLGQVFSTPRGPRRLRSLPHRVAVYHVDSATSPHKLVNVVSQSDLIAFALQNRKLIPEKIAKSKLEDLKLVRGSIMVRLDTPFVDTLEMMYSNRISGMALIDQEGRVSTSFSASDLRGINDGIFEHFLQSTLHFLVKGTNSKLQPPITIRPTDTLLDAIQKLADNHVHRLFVTDTEDHITGLATMSDLLPRLF